MVQCFCAFAAAFALPPACTEVEKPSFAEPWALAWPLALLDPRASPEIALVPDIVLAAGVALPLAPFEAELSTTGAGRVPPKVLRGGRALEVALEPQVS